MVYNSEIFRRIVGTSRVEIEENERSVFVKGQNWPFTCFEGLRVLY